MKVRFAVGSPQGAHSSVWRLWRHTNPARFDVFLATRAIAGAMKISFHESGEIRDAFSQQYHVKHFDPARPRRRERAVWDRKPYSAGGIARVYQVCIPHSELRPGPLGKGLKETDVQWIPPSESRNATFIEFMMIQAGRDSVELRGFEAAPLGPLARWFLPNGEHFLAVARYADLDDIGKAHIRAAVAKMTHAGAPIDDIPGSLRVILTTEPKDGMGITVETAWPCTV